MKASVLLVATVLLDKDLLVNDSMVATKARQKMIFSDVLTYLFLAPVKRTPICC